jgi:hypothetical protein
MIELSDLEKMFSDIADGPKWNMAEPMLWGYFFTDPSEAKLGAAAAELEKQGYRFVAIFAPDLEEDEAPYFFLHVECEEVHTRESLHARNAEHYELAERLGLSSYDGMDVGPVQPRH